MKTLLILIFASTGLSLAACSQNKSVNLSDEKIEAELQKIEVGQAEKAEKATAEDDSVSQIPYYTATLTTWETYFRTHNKFKDWDPKDPKMVMIGADIDKYGKPHHIKVVRSSKNKELDKEAIRLIQQKLKTGNRLKTKAGLFLSIFHPNNS